MQSDIADIENATASERTWLNPGVSAEGRLDGGQWPVDIGGQFKGEISGNEVIISQEGVVNGSIIAERVVIYGVFNGELDCYELEICENARVEGEIKSNNFSVTMGAEVVGSVSKSKKFSEKKAL